MCSVVNGSPPGKCRCHFESIIFKPFFRPTTQITQSIRKISHNALFCSRNLCARFWHKMVHCGIWDWCMVGSVEQVYSNSTMQQVSTSFTVDTNSYTGHDVITCQWVNDVNNVMSTYQKYKYIAPSIYYGGVEGPPHIFFRHHAISYGWHSNSSVGDSNYCYVIRRTYQLIRMT